MACSAFKFPRMPLRWRIPQNILIFLIHPHIYPYMTHKTQLGISFPTAFPLIPVLTLCKGAEIYETQTPFFSFLSAETPSPPYPKLLLSISSWELLPPWRPKSLSPETKKAIESASFRQEEPGQDRAMLLETNQSAWDKRMRLMSMAKERIILPPLTFGTAKAPGISSP